MIKYFFKNELTTIYNGDCLEIMEQLNNENFKIDKIITSPPYNIIRPNSPDMGYDLYKDRLMTNEQYIDWIIKIFDLYNDILNENGCVIWNMSYGCENTTLMSLCIAEIIKRTKFTLADILIWKKDSAIPNNVSTNKMTRICEFVYVFCREKEFMTFKTNKKIIGKMKHTNQPVYENVFNFFECKNNDKATELNKATFSTDFVKNIIDRYVKNNDVVLDNFGGTMTTSIACESRNIKSISIELSKKQCEYGVERIKKGIQLDIFGLL